MTMIAFTRNYHDHSNNLGYQFEFFCDKCNNGHRSAFKANKVGMAGEFMRAAGSLFGGVFSSAANASAKPGGSGSASAGTAPGGSAASIVGG